MKAPQVIIEVMEGDELELFENLAFAEHAGWAHWMKYLFSKCKTIGNPGDDDYGYLIPMESVLHWARQTRTPYNLLSEKEKESDRDEVRKIWHLIEPLLKEK